MLLDAKELKPNDLAREVYQQVPTNSSFAATYAFSLYQQKKSAEALKVMRQLKPQELDIPSIAGYYGVILKATGDGANARIYLDKAAKARAPARGTQALRPGKGGNLKTGCVALHGLRGRQEEQAGPQDRLELP